MANYTGTVKWYDSERGYGFISANDGRDVFLHHSKIKEKRSDKVISEGDSVGFDILEEGKGPAAVNVHRYT